MKIKGIYLLYRSLQAFGFPAVFVYLVVRALRRRAYFLSLGQRLGSLPASYRQTTPGSIWLHAVSVGEAITSVELVRQLRRELPRSPVFVSVATLAGYETALQKLRGEARVFYAPIDYVFAVRRVLRTLRPALVIVMETEIWPNLFREVKRYGAGLLLVNARISDRAAGRYRGLRWFFTGVLAHADLVLAQSELLRERWIDAGARPEKVKVGGNLKYDFQLREAPPDSLVRLFIERVQPRAVWIAASTMPPAKADDPEENEAVIGAFEQAAAHERGLLLVLAPRRPEHFDAAAQALDRAGIPFVRRSTLGDSATVALPGALLLDSIGELASLFGLATVVFMGGTLASRGGHNILEPALAARPIITGPHLENFAEIAAGFRAVGALFEVRNPAMLGAAVTTILGDREQAAVLGAKAQACARARQGATAMAVRAAVEIFSSYVPVDRPAQPAFLFLWLLSRLWIVGGTLNRMLDLARRRCLDASVISVGNITVGGTGKTPVVLYIARALKAAGRKPGILTRGYGRHSPFAHQALAAGSHVPVEWSGDEPQMFLRSGVAPVGIGPDRWHAGRLLESEFGVDALILDDGFQHVRLDRRLDIVLVDALNPFGGGYPLPLGRLRETLAGLARADVFVITRSDSGRVLEGTEHTLRQSNARAPMFRAHVRPETWVPYAGGKPVPAAALPYARVAAFCGLGNPESFWQTLEMLGCHVVDRLAFADHHAYTPREVRSMAYQFLNAGAQAILMTEKDFVNLCHGAGEMFGPLPLYWLSIGVVMEREREFLELCLAGNHQ